MPQQAKIEADTGNVIVTVLAPLPEKDDLPHCTEQWGTTERPANYTVAAQLPIAYTSTAYIILGIGIVAPDDNNAKTVSNIYNLTTKTSASFRTENENAPSVRYIAIGR